MIPFSARVPEDTAVCGVTLHEEAYLSTPWRRAASYHRRADHPDHRDIATNRGADEMKTTDDHREWANVMADEMVEVRRRRADEHVPDDTLIGLAISGGGIRSATFGLGILECLKGRGLLKRVDLLSTVSGGGYIGAWLSAGCRRHLNWLDPQTDWKPSIGHLRRYSNYLSPKVGFFSADTWSMGSIWLRNTLLIQVTVILAIACALLLPRLLFEGFEHWREAGNWRWATIILFVFGTVGIAGNQMRLTSHGIVPLLRARSWPLGLALGGICLTGAWFYGRWMNFDPFHGGLVSYQAAAPIAGLLVLGGFALQPVAVHLVASLWPGDNPPEQINYTQAWVQWAVVAPLAVVAFLVAAILWSEASGTTDPPGLNALTSYGDFLTTAWKFWPFPLSVVFVSFWLLSFCSIHSRNDRNGLAAALLAPCAAVLVLHALLCAVMLLLHGWAASPGDGAWKAFIWGPPLVSLAFIVAIVVLIGMMGKESTDDVREWWSRLGAWLGIYATAWMTIAVSAIYGPLLVEWAVNTHPWRSLTVGGGWLGTVLAGLFGGKSESTGERPGKTTAAKVKDVVTAVAPFVFIAGLLISVSCALHKTIELNSGGLVWSSVGVGTHLTHAAFLRVSGLVLLACAGALTLMAARVDLNEFSLNSFYRHRLVRCYLGATRFAPGERNPQNFTGFDEQDDMLMADLVEEGRPSPGPLHIVNCALNLGGSSDLALHTRRSAAYTINPLYCGSAYKSRAQSGETQELGYVPTRRYGGRSGSPTLGQAISVSGAAASPNMGYHTSPVVAFLLTVFNVRLGWWFPNPGKVGAGFPSPRFSLRYLFAELFGGATDKSRFVMISDGGHFENLAVYELVRRRCRLIIVSDGECDPKLTFEGLGTLIRMCDVDFGAKITLGVASLRPESTHGWSAQHWAVGRIEYGDGIPDGTLIYLKASMTGQENTSLLQYKASHPAFPHESTGDQFYGEDQFESYRRLGHEVATDALEALTESINSV